MIKFLKDMCFPISCICCDEFVDSEGLCHKCWGKIKWIADPKCKICGLPFEIDTGMICIECMNKQPFFDQAIAVLEYDDNSKDIILKFKHYDVTYISKQLAIWMNRVAENEIKNSDMIIPVPIHFRKRLFRKYNQSELLAMELSKISGINYEPEILIKKRHTTAQEDLSKKERKKNIVGTFDVKKNNKLSGKKIILIDDVFTTGSTVNECSKILRKNGAKHIIVLTIARVP